MEKHVFLQALKVHKTDKINALKYLEENGLPSVAGVIFLNAVFKMCENECLDYIRKNDFWRKETINYSNEFFDTVFYSTIIEYDTELSLHGDLKVY